MNSTIQNPLLVAENMHWFIEVFVPISEPCAPEFAKMTAQVCVPPEGTAKARY
jgi:hypothetical protein